MASFLKMLDFLSLINKQYCQSSLCRTLANGHHARWYNGYQRPGTSIEKISPQKTIDSFKKVVEELKTQCGLVKKEAIDFMKDFDQKPVQDYIMNQTKVVWEFRSEEDINKWVLGSDTAIGGKSEITIKLDKNKQYASLSGNLNTTVPHDGVTKYSGYCAMISKPEMLAFHRTKVHDWSNFNSLCLRVRGDGRPWMLNINPNKFDPTSVKDSYNYFIFPRGGPYWEEIEVPFSKFFFTSHGRIQDGQYEIWPDREDYPLGEEMFVYAFPKVSGGCIPPNILLSGNVISISSSSTSLQKTLKNILSRNNPRGTLFDTCLQFDEEPEFETTSQISTLGLTLADKVDGPFQLDIDFIGLFSDRSHTETFAYELYERNSKK